MDLDTKYQIPNMQVDRHLIIDDNQRRKKIYLIVLVFSLFLSLSALVLSVSAFLYDVINGKYYPGANPLVILLFFSLFVFAFHLTRSNHLVYSKYLFLFSYILAGSYVGLVWSPDAPIVLLIYSLVIVLAGIILSARSAFTFLLISATILFTQIELIETGLIAYDYTWVHTTPTLIDAIVPLIALGLISLVSWISNRETEMFLKRASISERALLAEKSNLEFNIRQRTKELERVQMEKLFHVYRFADFGRLAAGLIHDLTTPLSTISINLDAMNENRLVQNNNRLSHINENISLAIKGTKRMEHFINSARLQLQHENVRRKFDVDAIVYQTSQFYKDNVRNENIEFRLNLNSDTQLIGDPARFNQVISNIISNACDSLRKSATNRVISIFSRKSSNQVIITIADNGIGIPKSFVKKIFHPFFSTKETSRGMGIGLYITKNIIENDYDGKLEVASKKDQGCRFKISIPTNVNS